jgi:L-aspartate oxidase
LQTVVKTGHGTDLIPIIPAEHYHMGGAEIDVKERSSLQGLSAADEVACTGIHRANYWASNSLLEAVVFAARIAEDIGTLKLPTAQPSKKTRAAHSLIEVVGLEVALRHSVAQHVGVMRNHVGLVSSLKKIVQIQKQAKTLSSKNMATSCLMIAAVALERHESHGGALTHSAPMLDLGLDIKMS